MNRAANRAFDLELSNDGSGPGGLLCIRRRLQRDDPGLANHGRSAHLFALAATLRRLRIPLIVASILSIAGLGMYLTLQFGEGTGYYGAIPSRGDSGSCTNACRRRRSAIPRTAGPSSLHTSFRCASHNRRLGYGHVDRLGGQMRLRLAFEPILPGALLFAFASILGGRRQRAPSDCRLRCCGGCLGHDPTNSQAPRQPDLAYK